MEKQVAEERWLAEFPIWKKRRKKWVPEEFIRVAGTVRGKWFYADDGEIKRISAMGFSLLERLAEEKEKD